MQTDSNSRSDFTSTSTNAKDPKFLIPRSQRQKFFFKFTLMTLLGWVVGGITSIGWEKMLPFVLNTVVSPKDQIWYILSKNITSAVIFAIIFSGDQALVLRRYLSPWLWILATSAGWLISSGVSAAWNNYILSIARANAEILSPQQTLILVILSTVCYIFSGIWLGFSQWLVLRRYTSNAWWWNFLPSISFLFNSILVFLLSVVQNLIPEANRTQILYWSGQGFTALILGVIPAIGLCMLKRIPPDTTSISSSS